MKSHSRTGATAPRTTMKRAKGQHTPGAVAGAGGDAAEPALLEPATAAMAIISRCANHSFSQQVENAYRAAAQARDYAKAAATVAAKECPPGPARDALLATWARQRADAERLMHVVLRFGRENGHLAFAFSVYR